MKKFSVFLFFLLLPVIAYADTLVLKSGKTITGKILQETSEFVQIEYNGSEVYFERKAIKQIDKENATNVPQPEKAVVCSDAQSCLQQGLGVFASPDRVEDDGLARAKKYFEQGIVYGPENQDLKSVMFIVNDAQKGVISREYAGFLLSGSFYLMTKEYEKGIASLEKALATSPNDANINYNLGLAHHLLGRDRQALPYLEKLIEMDPGDAQAYSLAAVAYFAVGERQQAKEYLLIARKLFEKNNDSEKVKDIDSLISSSF